MGERGGGEAAEGGRGELQEEPGLLGGKEGG